DGQSWRGGCYGTTVGEVVGNAGAFNDAMRDQQIASCGKHLAGYSAATVDAHHGLPKIDRTREELDREELAVFRQFTGRDESPLTRPRSLRRPWAASSRANSGLHVID